MRGPRRQWWVSSGAAIAAASLHALMFAPLLLGTAAHRRPPAPDQPGAGASALASSAQVVEAMTLVDLSHTTATGEPPLEDIASLGIELPQAALTIVSPDPVSAPVFDEAAIEDSAVTEAAGDTQGHALMFGRYLGQIDARIERAWSRPRGAIGASRFSCQTKIEQDEDGKVLSVELRHCNGDAHWQRSLVAAIQHASPLPAPLVPSVFSRFLTLNFSADAWLPGISNPRDYEPEMRLAVATPREASAEAASALADMSRQLGAVDLRIEGKTVTWTPHESTPSSATTSGDPQRSTSEIQPRDESPSE